MRRRRVFRESRFHKGSTTTVSTDGPGFSVPYVKEGVQDFVYLMIIVPTQSPELHERGRKTRDGVTFLQRSLILEIKRFILKERCLIC